MQPILDRWQNMDYAILGIGRTQERDELCQFRSGGANKLEEISKCPDIVVGDLCARRFNIRGEFAGCDFNNKLIGVDGEILKATKNVIAIAAGSGKTFAIIGALRTGLIHYFIIDENTAIQVLELRQRNDVNATESICCGRNRRDIKRHRVHERQGEKHCRLLLGQRDQ